MQKKFSFLIMITWCITQNIFAKPLLCQDERYICYRVKAHQSWESLFKDEQTKDMVMRLNHTNQPLYRGRWIVIPKDLNFLNILQFSPLPMTISDNEGEKVILFDPQKYAFGAYDENGNLVRWGPATGGGDWCNDIGADCRTTSGEFRLYSLGNSECVSTKFPIPEGGAPMPYCMFFNGGQAFHGSPDGVLKGNASHGCVRLFVEDAEWLRYDFAEAPSRENHYRGTKVIIMPYNDDV